LASPRHHGGKGKKNTVGAKKKKEGFLPFLAVRIRKNTRTNEEEKAKDILSLTHAERFYTQKGRGKKKKERKTANQATFGVAKKKTFNGVE